ncbi:MAG: selenide, water dikinase SelD [Deltaproteobacteria bacterium]|nr:selenide, water dikinase SelD [Deltaproteobacteria bacterium]
MKSSTAPRHDLVLIGGGHSHVQVLRSLVMKPEPAARVTVVLDQPVAVYSGMVPGFVAGDYGPDELSIDVVPLARRAGAAVVLAPAESIDPRAKLVYLEGRPPLPYDVASINVGSTVRGLHLPGVREHALPTRPIGRFARLVDDRAVSLAALDRPARVVVVGAGAGGVELAFTLGARLLRATGRSPEVTLLDGGTQILPGYPASTQRLVARRCADHGVALVHGGRVREVTAEEVLLEDGRSLPCDLPVWVTGAAPLPLLAASDLPTDAEGFIQVRPTLQVPGFDDLFAAGDCNSMADFPWVKKAGVYAVREGPYLTRNLRARLHGTPVAAYTPQRDFLSLLYLGGGEAVASKWGQARAGSWVWRLKDRIDRAFVQRFQVLGPDGAPAPSFPTMETMEEMHCGGCAAKVGQDVLEGALSSLPPAPEDPRVVLGLSHADDAAAVTTPGGDTLVTTVDAFEAFTEDPYVVGRVAAVNAISDLYAKGIDPSHALAIVGVPDGRPSRVGHELAQALHGVRAALDPIGCTVLGGHTIRAETLTVGLTVTGYLPSGAKLLSNDGLREGDALILTKPLGTGVLFFADMQGRARGIHVQQALASMERENREASLVAREFASAATDISGFGLAGHLGEMLAASGFGATLNPAALPALPGVESLLAQGLRSTFHDSNRRANGKLLRGDTAHPKVPLLFDPQTSGGLLLSVPQDQAEAALERLGEGTRIGTVVPGEGIQLSSD